MIDISLDFLPCLNNGINEYPVYVYQMIGTTIRILGRSASTLIAQLFRDTRWFKFTNAEETKSMFFLVQSIVNSGYTSEELDNIVRILL